MPKVRSKAKSAMPILTCVRQRPSGSGKTGSTQSGSAANFSEGASGGMAKRSDSWNLEFLNSSAKVSKGWVSC